MDRIRVLIAKEFGEYGELLGRQLACRHPDIDVRSHSLGPGAEPASRPQSEEADLILIPEELAGRIPEKERKKYAVLVEEAPPAEREALEKTPAEIYRYAGSEALAMAIRIRYSLLTGRHSIREEKRRACFTGFYSSCGGSGKTFFCRGVAELLAESGERVLYLDMGELWEGPSAEDGGEGEEKARLADLLYYLFSENRKQAASFPKAFLRSRGGVDTFCQCAGRNPLRELETGELSAFFQQLCRWDRYDHILMDLGTDLWEGTCMALDLCESVFLIGDGSRRSRRRDRALIAYLEKRLGADFLDKLTEVRSFPGEIRENDGPRSALLPADVSAEEETPCHAPISLQRGEMERLAEEIRRRRELTFDEGIDGKRPGDHQQLRRALYG
ncbi:MAG: hypothetical protein Q4C22_07000 [Bacillota bacterium]|nr:hypothetical protein [Bacillota bacterium]